MFNRPRCRDWSALATQQLRLRNLIQISGHNIICNEKCSIYFTLHMSSMSSPFFTSEKCDTPNNALWPEINIQNIYELGTRSVCVRVWEHTNEKKNLNDDSISIKIVNVQQSDKLLFLWGVYFSGLVNIPNRTTYKLKENTLIFQMHGGYFTSPEYILNEDIVNRFTSPSITPITASPSHSPLSIFLTTYSTKLLNSKTTVQKLSNNIKQDCDDTNTLQLSRQSSLNSLLSNSPKINQIDNNEIKSTKNNLEIIENPKIQIKNNNSINKLRYISKEFLNSEIRPSYDVKRLLQLQEQQRFIKYKTENSKQLMEKICMKSAFCLNLDLFSDKSLIYQHKNQHKISGMGRTLNRLLFQQNEPPNPEDLLKAQNIRRKIEIAKFRSRLLIQERDRTKTAIRHLENKLGELTDGKTESESWLMLNYRNLSRDKDLAMQEKIHYAGLKEVYTNSRVSLYCRRLQLLKELNEIYLLVNINDYYSINGILLPDAESYTENTTSSDLSVALGYTAHAVLLCSVILNTPLRNPIIHEGSRSKIVDNVKNLPPNNREFPLFSKERSPPNDILYGVFLLNQNIAQLKFQIGLSKGDLRATLPNLLQLLNGPPKELAIKNLLFDSLSDKPASISNSSVDLLDCIVPPFNKDLNIGKYKNKGHRICRSVGSFTDEKFASDNSKYNSEPFLPTQTSNQNINSINKLFHSNQNDEIY